MAAVRNQVAAVYIADKIGTAADLDFRSLAEMADRDKWVDYIP